MQRFTLSYHRRLELLRRPWYTGSVQFLSPSLTKAFGGPIPPIAMGKGRVCNPDASVVSPPFVDSPRHKCVPGVARTPRGIENR
jgi:hypothetical protein